MNKVNVVKILEKYLKLRYIPSLCPAEYLQSISMQSLQSFFCFFAQFRFISLYKFYDRNCLSIAISTFSCDWRLPQSTRRPVATSDTSLTGDHESRTYRRVPSLPIWQINFPRRVTPHSFCGLQTDYMWRLYDLRVFNYNYRAFASTPQ